MQTYTIADIRKLGPCYDPTRYLPEDWRGTAVDVLRVDACPAQDRFWVALQLIEDERILRLFAVWCASSALALVDAPDPRSVAACDVAERYANGLATDDELAAARAAAESARSAADAAARSAAESAWSAAESAAWSAARAAAWSAAESAWSAAESAWSAAESARSAARAAAWSAADAAWAAAESARSAQVAQLITLIEED